MHRLRNTAVSFLFKWIALFGPSVMSMLCLFAGNQVNHVYARNPKDGATAYHRAVEGGDNVSVLNCLLSADESAVNERNFMGLSPLHLACKMNRTRTVQKLIVRWFACCIIKVIYVCLYLKRHLGTLCYLIPSKAVKSTVMTCRSFRHILMLICNAQVH